MTQATPIFEDDDVLVDDPEENPFAGPGLMGPDLPASTLPAADLAVSRDELPAPTIAPPEEPDLPANVEQVGGYLINAETGEVVGHAHLNRDYRITSDDLADHVLEAMQEEDAEILKLETLYHQRQESLRAMIAAHQRRRDWLEVRFKADLQQFAASRLAGSKRKSFQLFHGKLAFRASTSLTVAAERKDAAVEWCNRFCREAVKVSVDILIPPLKKRSDLPPDLFERVEKDTFSVDTGVK